MSENIDLKSIIEIKRKAKASEEEASVYDIGFEPPTKKSSIQSKQVFAVVAEKNRRFSLFTETSQTYDDESKEKQQDENQNKIGLVCNIPLVDKQNQIQSETQSNQREPIDFVMIPSTQTKNLLVGSGITDQSSIQFPLNADDNDDLCLIQNLSSEENKTVVEPLIFKNGYFKIIHEQDMLVHAMCVICGVDENNKPNRILKAQKNVSSNFISHFKVNVQL